eukprot:891540_1
MDRPVRVVEPVGMDLVLYQAAIYNFCILSSRIYPIMENMMIADRKYDFVVKSLLKLLANYVESRDMYVFVDALLKHVIRCCKWNHHRCVLEEYCIINICSMNGPVQIFVVLFTLLFQQKRGNIVQRMKRHIIQRRDTTSICLLKYKATSPCVPTNYICFKCKAVG